MSEAVLIEMRERLAHLIEAIEDAQFFITSCIVNADCDVERKEFGQFGKSLESRSEAVSEDFVRLLEFARKCSGEERAA